MTRLLVFGISGATWKVIDPLLARGKMRNLGRLIDGGCRAVLTSSRAEGDKHFRPQVAWPTLATGVEPARHGITQFFHTAQDVLAPTIWDRIESAGGRVGLFGWPITWPPREVNGFLIPGYDARDTATWPADLSFIRTLDRRQEAARAGRDVIAGFPLTEALVTLQTLLKAGVKLRTLIRLAVAAADAKLKAPAELVPLLIRTARLHVSGDIFTALCGRHTTQFSGFVTFLVDYASHRFWLFREPERFADAPSEDSPRLRSSIDDAYEAVDEVLGRICRSLGPETIVAVASEHGMEPETVSTEIGPWHYVLRPNRLRDFVGLPVTVTSNPVARWIAFRPPPDLMADALKRFRSVAIDGTARPLFQVYEHRGEVIVKLALARDQHGHLSNLECLRVRSFERVVSFGELAQRFGRRRSAMHARDAMLVLHGPGLRRGAHVGLARLVDVAPTLMEAMGLPVGRGLDGHPLEVFRAN